MPIDCDLLPQPRRNIQNLSVWTIFQVERFGEQHDRESTQEDIPNCILAHNNYYYINGMQVLS
jgi:hypothetical protein